MVPLKLRLKYTHFELGKDRETGMSAYYTPQKEVRLDYDGRRVLYVAGHAVVESWCCGMPGAWEYVIVPGYIVNWQKMRNEEGLPVSEVEPILDETIREEIRKTIRSREGISQVEFW